MPPQGRQPRRTRSVSSTVAAGAAVNRRKGSEGKQRQSMNTLRGSPPHVEIDRQNLFAVFAVGAIPYLLVCPTAVRCPESIDVVFFDPPTLLWVFQYQCGFPRNFRAFSRHFVQLRTLKRLKCAVLCQFVRLNLVYIGETALTLAH